MADFSHYGGPSEEWLEVEKTITLSSATEGLSVSQRKLLMNKNREEASAKAMEALKDQVQIQDHTIPVRDGSTIQARSYRPTTASSTDTLPVFLYFHGGGFLMGTIDTEDATCARLAVSAGVLVLHVNYRHTPEFPYPTAWDDAEDGFEWLHQNIHSLGGDPEKIIVGGTSAGAQLTASLTLQKHLGKESLARYPAIAGQALMIPCLVHMDIYDKHLERMRDPSVSSYKENENAPILPVHVIRMFLDLLDVKNPDPSDLRLCPGNVPPEKVRGLPPTTFGIAGLDPLRDEGLLYSQLLSEAGVPTDTYLFKGVPHGLRRFGQLSESKRWDAVLDHAVQWSLSKPKAGGFNIKLDGPE